MSDLKVWADGQNWVVASSPEDAADVFAGTGFEAEEDPVWRAWPPGVPLTITDDNGKSTRLTCEEWCKRGRAYLGSFDY